MLLLQQMIVLFFLMLVGFMIRKKEFITDASCKHLSWIVVNIANPALILSGSIGQQDGLRGKELLYILTVALSIFAIMMALSWLLPFLLKIKREDWGIYSIMLVFSNIGFMGFPLIQALYGKEALLYAAVFQIPFNILIYTYGILVLQKKDENKTGMSFRKIINVGTVCCVIALIISMGNFHIPTPVASIITHLSNLTAPLSMMVIGASMVHISLKNLCKDGKLMVFTLLKLVVLPVLFLFVLKGILTDKTLLGVCMVMVATPVASMTAMLAEQVEGNYELASKSVALSTILSVVTMPVVSMLTGI